MAREHRVLLAQLVVIPLGRLKHGRSQRTLIGLECVGVVMGFDDLVVNFRRKLVIDGLRSISLV